MTIPLFVHPAASLEIASARSWYDDISPALGNDFARAVAEAIEVIRHNPRIYADIGDGFHRAITKRFPYQVFYRIGDDQISILAVQHSHGDRDAVLEQASRREAQQ
jgi:plasmid stabilization system protein ParE